MASVVSTPSSITLGASASASPAAAVLLVDDRPANLVALEATLAPLGVRMVTAVSGRGSFAPPAGG